MYKKTNKDLLYGIGIIIWVLAAIFSYIFFGQKAIVILNIIAIVSFGIIKIIKFKHPPFDKWLKKRLI